MRRFLYTTIFALAGVCTGYGQALDQLGIKKGVTMSGSINATTTAYKAYGIEQRRDPLAWYLNGNINIGLFGYAMPFSFSYSNQGKNYSQPFNQFRFAPTYKWARLYVGTTSMNFSNYTLAGHMFNGVGLELTPGKWRFAAMYGTLIKAVPYNVLDSTSYSRMAFERKGYGAKVGYENNGNTYGIAVFTAKDDPNSIPYIPATAEKGPRQNLAVAFNVKQHITRRIFADAEYSVSALNRDVRSEKNAFDSSRGTSNLLSRLLRPTNTTRYFDAIQAGVGYNGNFYSIQLRYERVAPDFVTLGAYNVVNDMRNITVAPTLQLFGGKVNLSGNVGMQVNNLDNSKTSDSRRWVASVNGAVVPNEHWALNAGYSNFSNFTRVRPLADPYFSNPLDTLDYYQVNTTYNGMVMYRTGTKDIQHVIALNTSYQNASDKSTEVGAVDNLSKFFTSNLSYSYNLVKQAASITGSVNYYYNTATSLNTTFIGPNMNVSKQFFEKTFKAGLNATYNITSATTHVSGVSTTSSSNLFNTGLTLGYSPKAKKPEEGKKTFFKPSHSFSGSLLYLQKGAVATMRGYSEWTGTLNYTYSF